MMALFRKKEAAQFKSWHGLAILAIIIVALVLRLAGYGFPTAQISFGDIKIKVLVADTPARWLKGLSGRATLGRYQGMLFLFPNRGEQAMVMRAMRLPLDFIWLDEATIVDIIEHAQPEPGRSEQELKRYVNRKPATAVLEAPAGFAADHRLRAGDRVIISR